MKMRPERRDLVSAFIGGSLALVAVNCLDKDSTAPDTNQDPIHLSSPDKTAPKTLAPRVKLDTGIETDGRTDFEIARSATERAIRCINKHLEHTSQEGFTSGCEALPPKPGQEESMQARCFKRAKDGIEFYEEVIALGKFYVDNEDGHEPTEDYLVLNAANRGYLIGDPYKDAFSVNAITQGEYLKLNANSMEALLAGETIKELCEGKTGELSEKTPEDERRHTLTRVDKSLRSAFLAAERHPLLDVPHKNVSEHGLYYLAQYHPTEVGGDHLACIIQSNFDDPNQALVQCWSGLSVIEQINVDWALAEEDAEYPAGCSGSFLDLSNLENEITDFVMALEDCDVPE